MICQKLCKHCYYRPAWWCPAGFVKTVWPVVKKVLLAVFKRGK